MSPSLRLGYPLSRGLRFFCVPATQERRNISTTSSNTTANSDTKTANSAYVPADEQMACVANMRANSSERVATFRTHSTLPTVSLEINVPEETSIPWTLAHVYIQILVMLRLMRMLLCMLRPSRELRRAPRFEWQRPKTCDLRAASPLTLISLWRILLVMLLIPADASSSGLPSCPCLTGWNQTGYLTDSGLAAEYAGTGTFVYPLTYGLTCTNHDEGLEPFCSTANPPPWCSDSWVRPQSPCPMCQAPCTWEGAAEGPLSHRVAVLRRLQRLQHNKVPIRSLLWPLLLVQNLRHKRRDVRPTHFGCRQYRKYCQHGGAGAFEWRHVP